DHVERDAARLERAGEVGGARLVLVQHQHPDVPAPLPQPRKQREQVRLRAGDAGDLLQVQDADAAHRSPSRPPRPCPGDSPSDLAARPPDGVVERRPGRSGPGRGTVPASWPSETWPAGVTRPPRAPPPPTTRPNAPPRPGGAAP